MATTAESSSVKTAQRKPIQQQPTRSAQAPRRSLTSLTSVAKSTTPNSAAARRSNPGPSTAASTKSSRPVSGLDQRRASQVQTLSSATKAGDTGDQLTTTAVTSSKSSTTAGAGSRASQVLLNGDEEGYQGALNQLKLDALVPLIEDLADWLNNTLGTSWL